MADNKQLFCDLCKVSVSDERNMEPHINGKKHQSKLQQAKAIERKENSGIFATGTLEVFLIKVPTCKILLLL